ncbi:hypothetical protein D0Y65_047691 [Glycine soja]|uniref:Uncharacterized protein n=1 Tax=Glycine soja TaxID=3848 RepID=A0A445FPX2_GLYSO|nr:hypothetical protein D0Y65_047691 [Glycine soja]
MTKVSPFFPCLIILFLVASGTKGFEAGCKHGTCRDVEECSPPPPEFCGGRVNPKVKCILHCCKWDCYD